MLGAVLEGRKRKYLMMNAPGEPPPGARGAAARPREPVGHPARPCRHDRDPRGRRRDDVWGLLPRLKAAGASGHPGPADREAGPVSAQPAAAPQSANPPGPPSCLRLGGDRRADQRALRRAARGRSPGSTSTPPRRRRSSPSTSSRRASSGARSPSTRRRTTGCSSRPPPRPTASTATRSWSAPVPTRSSTCRRRRSCRPARRRSSRFRRTRCIRVLTEQRPAPVRSRCRACPPTAAAPSTGRPSRVGGARRGARLALLAEQPDRAARSPPGSIESLLDGLAADAAADGATRADRRPRRGVRRVHGHRRSSASARPTRAASASGRPRRPTPWRACASASRSPAPRSSA